MQIRIAIILVLALCGVIPAALGQTDASNARSALVEPVGSDSLLRAMHFSDTSAYAVIYLYRPLTGTFSGASIAISAGDDTICYMNNSAHYIFAIYRKGNFNLMGRFSRDSCPMSLDIEPGRAYYIRCKMDFGIFGSKNYKIFLEPMTAEKGKKQFDRTLRRRTFWS